MRSLAILLICFVSYSAPAEEPSNLPSVSSKNAKDFVKDNLIAGIVKSNQSVRSLRSSFKRVVEDARMQDEQRGTKGYILEDDLLQGIVILTHYFESSILDMHEIEVVTPRVAQIRLNRLDAALGEATFSEKFRSHPLLKDLDHDQIHDFRHWELPSEELAVVFVHLKQSEIKSTVQTFVQSKKIAKKMKERQEQ